MNDNEQAQTEESAALLQLLAMSVADVEAGRVHDSDEVFADARRIIAEMRKKAELRKKSE